VREQGIGAGFNEIDIKRAFDETAQRLMSRLRVDVQIKDIRAVAHQLASEVVADPERRRAPEQPRFGTPPRPQLHLVSQRERR
jgi:hypothetical protein